MAYFYDIVDFLYSSFFSFLFQTLQTGYGTHPSTYLTEVGVLYWR
jgi:hypothetical protein